MHTSTVATILNTLPKLPADGLRYRQEATFEKTLVTFEKIIKRELTKSAGQLIGRWKHCRKLIDSGNFETLLKLFKDSDGQEVSNSSLLQQHIRGAKLTNKGLSIACNMLIIELNGGCSKQYWPAIKEIRKNLVERYYLSQSTRPAFVAAEKSLEKLWGELNNDRFFQKGLFADISSETDRQDSNFESLRSKKALLHQTVIEGLNHIFHEISADFGSLNLSYSSLLKAGSNYISALQKLNQQEELQLSQSCLDNSPQTELNIKNQFSLLRQDLSKQILSLIQLDIEEADHTVEKIRRLLSLNNFKALLLAACTTDIMSGPAQAIDFNLNKLEEIFASHRKIHSGRKKNITLELEIAPTLTVTLNAVNIYHRAMLGWIFDNLILNAIQAIAKTTHLRNPGIIIRASAKDNILVFEVITKALHVPEEALSKIKSSIADYRLARAQRGKGGTGFPTVTHLLTHQDCLNSNKPRVENSQEGFSVYFKIDSSRLSSSSILS